MPDQPDARLERWSQIVHTALRQNSEVQACAALEAAATELAAAGPIEGEAFALGLALLRFQAELYFSGVGQPEAQWRGQARQLVEGAISQLEALSPLTDAAAAAQARGLWLVECAGDRAGVRELTAAGVDARLGRLAMEDRDASCWYCLAFWAFKHRHQDHMFAAYTEFLVRRKPGMTRYNWERIRLMYLLTAGQAIFRDIEAAIDKLPHKLHADHFAAYIKPRCEELEMWDEKLELKYVLKVVDLEERESEVTQPDPELVFGLPR